jgi:hypothetical protein
MLLPLALGPVWGLGVLRSLRVTQAVRVMRSSLLKAAAPALCRAERIAISTASKSIPPALPRPLKLTRSRPSNSSCQPWAPHFSTSTFKL